MNISPFAAAGIEGIGNYYDLPTNTKVNLGGVDPYTSYEAYQFNVTGDVLQSLQYVPATPGDSNVIIAVNFTAQLKFEGDSVRLTISVYKNNSLLSATAEMTQVISDNFEHIFNSINYGTMSANDTITVYLTSNVDSQINIIFANVIIHKI